MNPEQQTFTDSVQSEDINRIMGNPRQAADYDKVKRLANAVGWLMTSYAIAHREMLDLKVTKGVDDQGYPYVNVDI